MYLIDTHVHTAESSNCGRVPAEKQVEYYKGAGYSGIVITDHFCPGKPNLEKSPSEKWSDCLDAHEKGFLAAKSFETPDFRVYYGMEIRFKGSDNDYLVFGADRAFFDAHEELTEQEDAAYFSSLARSEGMAFYQAHPFRNHMVIVDPGLLDGIEVYNGNSGHNSRNDIAEMWAEKYHLRRLSGTDCHTRWMASPGGIFLERLPKDEKELASMLLNNEYRLRTPTEEV